MITGFHDEDYDGVVLKIPLWFIEMNGLDGVVQSLEDALKDAKMSIHLPDHIRNVYELENRKSKAKDVAEREREKKERMDNYKAKERERFRSLLAHDHYEIEYREHKIQDYVD